MTVFSVAEAKNKLPGLIDRAMAGEEVVITRHGQPVAELRPVTRPREGAPAGYAALRRQRDARKTVSISSVELLRLVYEDVN